MEGYYLFEKGFGLIRRWALIVAGILLIPSLLMPLSQATMGYSIRVNAEGTTWAVSRSTQTMYFYADGNVVGEGNFSRFARINGVMGIRADETASSPRRGTVSTNEKMRIFSKEGPVVVTANLESKDLTDSDSSSEEVTGFAVINIDETWPAYFSSYRQTNYLGPGIRARERYENNGDVVASLVESKKLSEQSIFTTSINKTLISAIIMPGMVKEWTGRNRSSFYATNMKTIGDRTSLNVIKRGIPGDIVSSIAEDYSGQVEMALRIHMDDVVNNLSDDESGWLPCCTKSIAESNVPIKRAGPADWFTSSRQETTIF